MYVYVWGEVTPLADCPFCRIVRREAPADILYEDDEVVVFKDTNPQAPVHFLVVPRRHIPSLAELSSDDQGLIGHAVYAGQKVAQQEGVLENGFRLVVNCRRQGGQTVSHLHLHVLGGRQMRWPPG